MKCIAYARLLTMGIKCNRILMLYAEVAELVDAHGSGPCESNLLRVQVPSSALSFKAFRVVSRKAYFIILKILRTINHSICNLHTFPMDKRLSDFLLVFHNSNHLC